MTGLGHYVAEKVSAMRRAEFFAAKRDEANIEVALQILRRRGGQPPNSDDGYPHEED